MTDFAVGAKLVNEPRTNQSRARSGFHVTTAYYVRGSDWAD